MRSLLQLQMENQPSFYSTIQEETNTLLKQLVFVCLLHGTSWATVFLPWAIIEDVGGWLLHISHNLKPFSYTYRKKKEAEGMKFVCGIDFSYWTLNDSSLPSG